jgi:hypothetical protein
LFLLIGLLLQERNKHRQKSWPVKSNKENPSILGFAGLEDMLLLNPESKK